MMYTAEAYTALFTQDAGSTAAVTRDVSGYRIKTVRAGDTLEIEGYAIWSTRQQATEARKQSEKHREQVQAINRRNSQKALRRLINANFGKDDLLLTLTYDRDSQPESEDAAKREVRNFLRRLRELRKRRGLSPLKYVYTTEVTHGLLGTRYHHHLIVSGGVAREDVEALWKHGLCNSRLARPDGYGLSAWAHYMSKQKATQEKAGRYGWTASRNMKKPTITHADHKITRRRMQRMAEDMDRSGREILERVYPGYMLVEKPEIRWSPYVAGVYLSARMVRA